MRYLIDTSALVRLEASQCLQAVWHTSIAGGEFASCYPQRLEYLYTARSFHEYEALADRMEEFYPDAPVPKHTGRWTSAVQHRMAKAGQHRSASAVDFVIAATAAHHGLTIVHDDNDFATVARFAPDVFEVNVHDPL